MGIKNIVVSINEEPSSIITVKYSIYIAKKMNAKLIGIYVVNEEVIRELLKTNIFIPDEARKYEEEIGKQEEAFLKRVKKMAESKGVDFESYVLKGVVHTEVIKKCKEVNGELLIIGELKKYISIKDIFYDEGEKIIREAKCPVVVVRNENIVNELYNSI